MREKRNWLTCHGQDGVCTRGRESGVWVTLTPPCCLVECYHSLTPPMALVRGWQAYGHGIVCRLGWPRGEVSTAGLPCFYSTLCCYALSGLVRAAVMSRWVCCGKAKCSRPPTGVSQFETCLPPMYKLLACFWGSVGCHVTDKGLKMPEAKYQ